MQIATVETNADVMNGDALPPISHPRVKDRARRMTGIGENAQSYGEVRRPAESVPIGSEQPSVRN